MIDERRFTETEAPHWRSLSFSGAVYLILGITGFVIPLVIKIPAIHYIGWLYLAAGSIHLYQLSLVRTIPGVYILGVSAALAMLMGIIGIFQAYTAQITLIHIVTGYFVIEGVLKLIYAHTIRTRTNPVWAVLAGALAIGAVFMLHSGELALNASAQASYLGVYLLINGISYMMTAIYGR